MIQDHVNGNLLFAGTEFGVFTSLDAGQRWTQLKGGIPVAQARDLTVQKRENDLVVATFGRGFYVLDDYSALRELTPQTLAEDAALLPLRDAYLYNQTGMAPAGTAGIGPMSGNWSAPNPPFGAVFTYPREVGAWRRRETGPHHQRRHRQQIRRLDLDKTAGLRRIAWSLRGGTPAAPAGGQQGFGGGRGGNQAPLVAPGRYRATLGRLTADKVTPIGRAQSFSVLPIELK